MCKPYYDNIADLVFCYHKQNKQIDDAYIEKLLEIVISNEDLYDYLKPTDFVYRTTKNKKLLMGYNLKEKQLRIFFQNGKISYCLPNCICDVKEQEYAFYFYFNETILHELEHVKHEKIRTSTADDLEAKLIRLSIKMSSMTEKCLEEEKFFKKIIYFALFSYLYDRYNSNYQISLEERLANVYAYQASSQIATILELPQISDYEKLQEYQLYTKTNSKVTPTIKYLEKICTHKEMESLRKYIKALNLSLKERLKFGLEITPLEFEQILLEKQELERKLSKIA